MHQRDSLKFPTLWVSVGLLMLAVVILVSLVPNPPEFARLRGHDKIGHFAAFILVTFWFGQIYTSNCARRTMAGALILVGIGMECVQQLGGYRSFEYADMGANAAGVLCALLLAQTPLHRCLAVVKRSVLRLS